MVSEFIPQPPQNFYNLNLDSSTSLEFGTWYRLNPSRHPSPLYFDRSGEGRFDSPNQSYGILYTGKCAFVTFAECFARIHGNRLITHQDLQARNLWQITSTHSLALLRLHGNALVQTGADAEVTSTKRYELPRQWAEAIYNHPREFDGIVWRSRLDDDRFCCGIFERAQSSLVPTNLGSLLNHQDLLGRILEHYCFNLDEES